MTSREFRERFARRASLAGAPIPHAESIDQLEHYFSLLSKWNERMNLTALPLQVPTDETFDRLLVEPLVAARNLPDRPDRWFDLGSGGGSPAIPIKITRPGLKLTMVEAKARKAAFLREAVRTLGLAATTVEHARFEAVAARMRGVAELITVRAIRVDSLLIGAAVDLLRPDGRLFLFRTDEERMKLSGFKALGAAKLGNSPSAFLMTYQRVFHVEQSD